MTGELEAAQDSARWITKDQQEQIMRRLHAVLSQGWTLTRTALNKTPDDWYTLDKLGFEIDGRNGEHVFQIWFFRRTGSAYARADRIDSA